MVNFLRSSRFALVAVVVLGLVGVNAIAATFSAWSTIKPLIAKVPSYAGPVRSSSGSTTIKFVNYGKVVYTGSVTVKPTLDRIRGNSKLSHGNDGSVFGNRERRLPSKPSGYYYEFVHWPTSTSSKYYGMSFPGPLRVIIGKNGEAYFTGDHYASFQIVN